MLFDHLNGVAHVPRRFLVTLFQRPEERSESVAKSVNNPFAVVHGPEGHTQFPFGVEQVLSETSAQTPEGYRGVWDDWQESDLPSTLGGFFLYGGEHQFAATPNFPSLVSTLSAKRTGFLAGLKTKTRINVFVHAGFRVVPRCGLEPQTN